MHYTGKTRIDFIVEEITAVLTGLRKRHNLAMEEELIVFIDDGRIFAQLKSPDGTRQEKLHIYALPKEIHMFQAPDSDWNARTCNTVKKLMDRLRVRQAGFWSRIRMSPADMASRLEISVREMTKYIEQHREDEKAIQAARRQRSNDH